MLEGTISANREARPPVQALSEAAAHFGPPVYVIGAAVAAAAARLEATFGSRHSTHALPKKTTGEQAGRGGQAAASLLDTGLEGPVCESTDAFGRHVLPLLDRGDLAASEQAGAYGASFTSRSNGRPAPANVVLCLDGSLQPCERPPITPAARTPGRTPYSAARPTRPKACHTVGSATVTKESLP